MSSERPFVVKRDGDRWLLVMRYVRPVGHFATQGEAIDHAYRNWPWWL